MVKETKVYVCSDGKEYKTKKAAERHENELVFKNMNLSVSEVSDYLEDLKGKTPIISQFLKSREDWRDWPNHIVKQIPAQIQELIDDIVVYQIVKKHWSREDVEVVENVKHPRLKDGEHPNEFQRLVEEKTNKSTDGSTFALETHLDEKYKKQYIIVEKELSPEDKLIQGFNLNEQDLSELVWGSEVIHQEKGEDRRWSRTIITVIELSNGDQYAIEWEEGLTENQENEFFEQPKKVNVKEKEVVKVVKEIEYL